MSDTSLTLLIDVDGTLIDSFPGIRDCFLRTLQELDWPIPDDETIARVPGPPMEQTLASLGMDQTLAEKGLRIYRKHYSEEGWLNATEFPGMRETLIRLREQGYRLCTATSKAEPSARRILERLDLIDLFEFIGAAQEYGPRRDKAAVIAYVLHSLGLDDASKILMVGDRLHDTEGAAQFGIQTCLVKWGYGAPAEHEAAAFTADTPEQLEEVIHEWNRN